MNHLDLFSGIGGFSLAMRNLGIKHGWHGYSDIDKYANNIFRRHFNEAEELGGIESIQPRDLPRLDLVTFGFPCQDLSMAGNRGGLQAARSGLFFEAMRIIRAKRPKHIIFENVKGLFSSNNGYDFILCLKEIAECGYDGQWQLLNTRWFLPQNRERVFFVGHLRGERRPKIFPIGEGYEKNRRVQKDPRIRITNASPREYDEKEISPSLMARDYKDPKIVLIDRVANGDAGRVFDPNGIACTLKAEGGGWGAKTGLYKMESQIRRLTPTECERLQGYPDGWTEGQSDTQRYKQLGNTVTVPVVESVLKGLIKEM